MTELKDIEVREVSLVDAGANPEANILFFKRKQEEESMSKKETTTEVVNKQEELKLDVAPNTEDVSKAAEAAATKVVTEKENTELKKRVAELEAQITERDAADKAAVEKAAADKAAADNAALVETLERLNKRLETEIAKREDNELMKVAAKYEIIGENADNTFKLLKSLKGTENYDLLIGTFDKVLAQVEKSGTFNEIGKSGYNSQAVSIEKIAAEIRKNDPSLTERQALDKAFQQNPNLEY